MSDENWINSARDHLMGDFGLPLGLATAAATALLAREKDNGRLDSDPAQVVQAHMDSDEPPIVDPDAYYGDDGL